MSLYGCEYLPPVPRKVRGRRQEGDYCSQASLQSTAIVAIRHLA